MTKSCSRCKQELPTEKFNIRNKNTGKLQAMCAECNKVYQQEHYQNNKKYYAVKAKTYDKIYKTNILEKLYLFLIEHPCVDCGETDPIVLEFDHREQSSKDFSIGNRLRDGYSWEKIMREVDKCDVRCANCHRRRTAVQLGWGKAAWITKGI